jgi:hypothetical protein
MTVVPGNRTETSSLIRLRPDQARTVSDAIAFVRDLGGRVIHAFSPQILLGVLPSQLANEDVFAFPSATEKLSMNERLGLDGWTLQHSPEFIEEARRRPHESISWGEVTPPDPPLKPPAEPPEEMLFASSIAQHRTRWGYCAFFTKYPVQHFAYARKPWIVMRHDNDGWGVENIDRVFAHETGHIFGCPDEYEASKCSCEQRFGFLRAPNGNCKTCATAFAPCIMEQNEWAMCDFTRVHLGWRDSDGDGILDLAHEAP